MKSVKKKLIEYPGEIVKFIIIVGNFNIFQYNLQIEKISNDVVNLNNTIWMLDLKYVK